MAERESQEIQLFSRGRKQEIRLVTRGIRRRMQLGAGWSHLALDVMPGGHAIGLKILGRFQQIFEFHTLVAANTRDRGCATKIAFGEFINDRVLENIFIIKDIVWKIHLFCDATCIVNVNSCATCPFFSKGRAMVIKL